MTGVYERHRDKLKIDVDELMAEQPTDRTIHGRVPNSLPPLRGTNIQQQQII